ncbi:uncharacterized protein ACNS7B_011728 [Menidia menidia]
MRRFSVCVVSCVFLCVLAPSGGRPQSGVSCKAHEEYPNGAICCLNCPAGQRVASPCTSPGETGTCEECPIGTFTEHPNGFGLCFSCSPCRPDQEVVRKCSSTQDTECRCKPGRFCTPEHACEICKRCSRCGIDEELVRNCTPTTNTECKKRPPPEGSSSVAPLVVAVVVGGGGLLLVAGLLLLLYKKRRAADSQRLPDRLKTAQVSQMLPSNRFLRVSEAFRPALQDPAGRVGGVAPPAGLEEEERQQLCDSLSSSASNSQHSLSTNPNPNLTLTREEDPFPVLVPVNGEESLRGCFEFLEELDVSQHRRFFRALGLSDNAVRSREELPFEDRLHELLGLWAEREGRGATLDRLLGALLSLGQRRTAERLREKALQHRLYREGPLEDL